MAHGNLYGALVVLTGASSGIGRAAAQAFARQGARLVLAARDVEALTETADECRALGGEVLVVATDVTHSDEVEALASAAAEFGQGRIDVWINNAGIGAVGAFDETPLDAHEQVVQTDLLGYLRGAHVVLPYFKQQKSGVLINTLSVGSWVAQPFAAAYSASKFGLRGLSQALRGELGAWPGIHICDVYPGIVDSPRLSRRRQLRRTLVAAAATAARSASGGRCHGQSGPASASHHVGQGRRPQCCGWRNFLSPGLRSYQ